MRCGTDLRVAAATFCVILLAAACGGGRQQVTLDRDTVERALLGVDEFAPQNSTVWLAELERCIADQGVASLDVASALPLSEMPVDTRESSERERLAAEGSGVVIFALRYIDDLESDGFRESTSIDPDLAAAVWDPVVVDGSSYAGGCAELASSVAHPGATELRSELAATYEQEMGLALRSPELETLVHEWSGCMGESGLDFGHPAAIADRFAAEVAVLEPIDGSDRATLLELLERDRAASVAGYDCRVATGYDLRRAALIAEAFSRFMEEHELRVRELISLHEGA